MTSIMTEADRARDLSIGQVQWHCSEEDGGPDVGVLLQLPNGKQLWCGELLKSESDAATGFVVYDGASKTLIGACDYDIGRSLVEDVLSPAFLALTPSLAAGSEQTDPDLGKIGPGHVCKHDIRWPHPCEPCDQAAWESRATPSTGGDVRND